MKSPALKMYLDLNPRLEVLQIVAKGNYLHVSLGFWYLDKKPAKVFNVISRGKHKRFSSFTLIFRGQS